MKALLKDLLPPILLRALTSARQPEPRAYESYEAAALDCQRNAYQAEEIVQVVIEKNDRFRRRLQSQTSLDHGALRTLIALGLSNVNGRLNVLDFGGGGGYHHAVAVKALGTAFPMRWNVVETPAMVKAAKRLERPGLKFFDDLDAAATDLGDVDLVFASGSLQYCPHPVDFLRRLVNVGGRYLFITRTPFAESGEDIVSRQESMLSSNGPGPLPDRFEDLKISYPITYASRSAVESILREKYEIRFHIAEDEAGFQVAGQPMAMSGYFCARHY